MEGDLVSGCRVGALDVWLFGLCCGGVEYVILLNVYIYPPCMLFFLSFVGTCLGPSCTRWLLRVTGFSA